MISRPVVVTSMLALGLWAGLAVPPALAQDSRDSEGRTVLRSVVEDSPTIRSTTVLSEVVDEAIQRDAETSQRTRQEFVTDADGRQQLISTMVEQRVVRPDGGHQIVREFTEPDLNGRSRATRREREELVAKENGLFVTEIEVAEPSINGGGFVLTERIEQQERRAGDQLVELERTTYSDPTGRGAWTALERRVLTRDYADGRAETVEVIYRPDSSRSLVQSERLVSREWTDTGGRELRTEEVYGRDINNVGALTRRPVQQVEVVRTSRPDGRSETTRTVSQRVENRMQPVERVVERSRPDGSRGTVSEQEYQQADADGRFWTVATGRTRESE